MINKLNQLYIWNFYTDCIKDYLNVGAHLKWPKSEPHLLTDALPLIFSPEVATL